MKRPTRIAKLKARIWMLEMSSNDNSGSDDEQRDQRKKKKKVVRKTAKNVKTRAAACPSTQEITLSLPNMTMVDCMATPKSAVRFLARMNEGITFAFANSGLFSAGVVSRESSTFEQIGDYLLNGQCKEFGIELMEALWVKQPIKGGICPASGIDNRQLLWHGTNPSLIMSQLKNGLVIDSSCAQYLDQTNIHFANRSCKFAPFYTEGSVQANLCGYMLLCEVQLGTSFTLQDAGNIPNVPPTFLKDGNALEFESVKLNGRYSPVENASIKIGNVKWPIGPYIKNEDDIPTSHSDEFIIYREDLINIRYIVKYKFTAPAFYTFKTEMA